MSNQSVSIPQSPLVVGSVQSLNQLACLQPVELKGLCDILEVRLDGMPSHIDTLNIELDRFNDFPQLFTARCASEGGLSDLSSRERAKLLTEVSKRAAWIDVELASYADMKDTLHQIRSEGVGLILSYHNFTETPQTSQLQDIVDLAGEADIIKIAVQHNNASDLTRCVETLQNNDHPMSMMGMGPLAPVSRLLYAQHGSLLNYGYLGNTETAPGQWPAKLLREAIATLKPIS
jgi:3-dehydroquinate dehydratase I